MRETELIRYSETAAPVAVRPATGLVSEKTREQLREAFVRESKPGDRVPSERELARTFGVSTATVSRALQELQHEGVLHRMPGKGTFISAAAPAPGRFMSKFPATNGLPHALEVVNPGERTEPQARPPVMVSAGIVGKLGLEETATRSTEYWANRVASAAERRIQQGGGCTNVVNRERLSSAPEIEAAVLSLEAAGANSIVFIGDAAETAEAWSHYLLEFQDLGGANRAVVQVLFDGPAQWPFDAVRFDGERGSYEATWHLLAQGHRSLSFIGYSADIPWTVDRLRGFRRALRGFGLQHPRDADLLQGHVLASKLQNAGASPSWEALGDEAADVLLAELNCTAVVAVNDRMARRVMERAQALHLPVPQALSIVGFDDYYGSNSLGLTTVHPPIEQMGEAAAELVTKRLRNPRQQERTELVLHPALVMRSSTRVPH